MDSLPVWTLDDRTRSFLLALALDPSDLALLAGDPERPGCGCKVSDSVLRVNRLHAATSERGSLARAVGDLLDLRYAAEVLLVRGSAPESLREQVHSLAQAGRGAELVPLLWPLASDARPHVRQLGAVALCEAFLAGCARAREAATAALTSRRLDDDAS